MIKSRYVINFDPTNSLFYAAEYYAIRNSLQFIVSGSNYNSEEIKENFIDPLPPLSSSKHSSDKSQEALNALRSYKEFNSNPTIEKDIVEAIKWLETSF